MEPEEYGKDRNNGRFIPGNKLASGRGPNKVSSKVKESILKFVEDNVDDIQASFDELDAKEKLEFISSLLSYTIPKLSATQIDAHVEGGYKITMNIDGSNRLHSALDAELPKSDN